MKIAVPPYMSEHLWTDVVAYEVVDHPSPQTIVVRRLTQKHDLSDCTFIPGGFAAHCPNPSAQKWTFASNPDAPTQRLRWSKKFGCFGGRRWSHQQEPYAYYDPNF